MSQTGQCSTGSVELACDGGGGVSDRRITTPSPRWYRTCVLPYCRAVCRAGGIGVARERALTSRSLVPGMGWTPRAARPREREREGLPGRLERRIRPERLAGLARRRMTLHRDLALQSRCIHSASCILFFMALRAFGPCARLIEQSQAKRALPMPTHRPSRSVRLTVAMATDVHVQYCAAELLYRTGLDGGTRGTSDGCPERGYCMGVVHTVQ